MFTAVVLPGPSRAGLGRAQARAGAGTGQGSLLVWAGTEHTAALDACVEPCWPWPGSWAWSSLPPAADSSGAALHSPGLQLIQNPGTDGAHPLAHPLARTQKQGQLWQLELWVAGVHISGILHSGCG